MIHSPKKLGECYDVMRAVITNSVEMIVHLTAKDLKRMYKRIIAKDCYISPYPIVIKRALAASTRTVVSGYGNDFNLPLFLSLVPSLNHQDWKGLIYFLKLSNLSTSFICNAMNKRYNPTDLHENRRMLQDRKSTFRKMDYKVKREIVGTDAYRL